MIQHKRKFEFLKINYPCIDPNQIYTPREMKELEQSGYRFEAIANVNNFTAISEVASTFGIPITVMYSVYNWEKIRKTYNIQSNIHFKMANSRCVVFECEDK